MRKRLIITDVTRMKENRVCIFGISEDENKEGIRLNGFTTEDYANENNIKPFNVIEFNLTKDNNAKPPHTEDWNLNLIYTPTFVRTLSDKEQRKFLEEISYKSVKDVFGVEIHDNKYLNEREGCRSIGTIKVENIISFEYYPNQHGTVGKKYDFRVTFCDQIGQIYDLPVVDLAFIKYCDNLENVGSEINTIVFNINETFKKSLVFLRIGVARPFISMYNRCYLQVSGIYTFPNYITPQSIE